MLTINNVWSQTTRTIQIIDSETAQPISGVSYFFGENEGVTDLDGLIVVSSDLRDKLVLSHLSYGTLVFRGDELSTILTNGSLILVQKAIELQPVNVIALRDFGNINGHLTFEEKAFLTHDAATILTELPEIAVIRKSGSYGFDPVLRGFKYEQLNIVIDGSQSAIAACPNRMDPPASQIAPNMMKQVELLKGPYNLRYGSNFGGTINFKSSESVFDDNRGLLGRLSAGYETNGNIFRTEGMLGHQGKAHDVKLFGAWSKGNDYTDGNDRKLPSAFQRASFGTRLGIRLSKQQDLALSFNGNIARDVDFAALAMDLRSDDTWLVKADHHLKFTGRQLKRWYTNIYGSFVNHVMDNLGKALDPRMVNAITDATTKTVGGRTEGKFELNSALVYVGADLKHESAQGERSREFLMGPNAGNTLFDNVWQDGQIMKIGGFAEFKYSLDEWDIVASTRIENNHAELGDAQPEFTGEYAKIVSNQLNVSASLGGIRKWNNKFSTTLWVGRASRSGSLTERYINYFPVGLDPYEMLGNPELKAEVNYQVDLNFNYVSQDIELQLTGFLSVLDNYISSVIRPDLGPRIPSSPGVRQFINLDEALITGAEMTWNQYLFAGISHRFSMAYTFGKDMTSEEALPEIAPLDLRYKLQGLYFDNKLKVGLGFRYAAQQDRVAQSFGETRTPSFALVDLEAGYRISSIISLRAGVNNLFNEAYYEHLNRSIRGTPPTPILAPGRNIFLTLMVDFQ